MRAAALVTVSAAGAGEYINSVKGHLRLPVSDVFPVDVEQEAVHSAQTRFLPGR